MHPDEYARINSLKKDGLKITIYDDRNKKNGHARATRVGREVEGSYLVTMEWNGAKDNSKYLHL